MPYPIRHTLLLALTLALSWACYWPGLSGPFLLDDFPTLEPLAHLGGVYSWETALHFVFGGDGGPTGRPLAMASFLLDDHTWPSTATAFKTTNVAIHLINGGLLFLLIRRLLQREFSVAEGPSHTYALIGMAIWCLHPLHVSTVLYVVQRMAMLSSTACLAAMLCYLTARERLRNRQGVMALAWAALSVTAIGMGVLSKENTVLIAGVIVLAELWMLPPVVSDRTRTSLRTITIALAGLILCFVYVKADSWMGGYSQRDFTFAERLALQPAALGDYLAKWFSPNPSKMNLFDGRFTPEALRAMTADIWTGWIVFSAALALCLFHTLARRGNRLVGLGLAWFFIMHAMESSILPLELYFEHRNYLPSLGLIIAMMPVVGHLFRQCSKPYVATSFACIPIAYLTFCTLLLTVTWGKTDQLLLKFTADEPQSLRAKRVYAHFLDAIELPGIALRYLDDAAELRPGLLSTHLQRLKVLCSAGIEESPTPIVHAIWASTHFDPSVAMATEALLAQQRDNSGHCDLRRLLPTDRLAHFVPTLKGFHFHRDGAVNWWVLLSDHHAIQRDFSPALEMIDHALALSPSTDLYIKKTVLLASGGLFDPALDSLARASVANAQRRFGQLDRAPEIGLLERSLRASRSHTPPAP